MRFGLRMPRIYRRQILCVIFGLHLWLYSQKMEKYVEKELPH